MESKNIKGENRMEVKTKYIVILSETMEARVTVFENGDTTTRIVRRKEIRK